MKWTDERPDVSGWWWMRQTPSDYDPCMTYVDTEEDGVWLRGLGIGCTYDELMVTFPFASFKGPLSAED